MTAGIATGLALAIGASLALNTGFLLQHTGVMNRGEPSLSITVVPDSGTEELAGLSGTLSINIVDGRHFYDFIYSMPAS